MSIFYRGKHSEKRWWEFWKPRGISKKLYEHSEVPIDITDEIELFKLELEKDEDQHNRNLLLELQALDIHRFILDCKKSLSNLSESAYFDIMSSAIEDANRMKSHKGCALMLCIFSKKIWKEVEDDEIPTMA